MILDHIRGIAATDEKFGVLTFIISQFFLLTTLINLVEISKCLVGRVFFRSENTCCSNTCNVLRLRIGVQPRGPELT